MVNGNLPDGWEWKMLGDVSISQSGAGFPKSYQGETEGDYPFAKVSDITNTVQQNGGSLVSAVNYLSSENARKIHAKVFPVGTTLFAKIGEAVRLNRRAIASVPALADNNVMGLIPSTDIVLPKYLYHFMHTVDLYEYSQATTVPSVRKSDVEQIAFPLPPLPEQERIVSRIEELFSDLEAGVAALERVRAGLRRYKASVLKVAVEGKLVNGKSGIGEGELPEGWRITKVEDIAETIGGVTKGRNFRGKKTVMLPYLRVANVQRGRLDLEEMKEIELLESEVEKYRLREGDVVLTEGGDWDKLGRSAIWRNQIELCVHQNHIFRARVNDSEILPEWLMYFTNSEIGQDYFKEAAKQTTNLASINLTQLRNCPVHLPPLEEQRRIVAEVERRLSVVGEVESAVEVGLARAARLRQSVLRSAFEGRL